MKVALYCRVSTLDQNLDMQRVDLTRYAEARGWSIHNVYEDKISGLAGSRPALDRLMDDARKRRFDIVTVWRFDRFARSTKHLLEALEEFRHLGIDFVSYQENIDTSNPLGRAVFTIISAVAQLERDTIVERTRAGIDAAKKRGVRWGRRRVDFDVDQALYLKAKGYTRDKIAKKLGVSRWTMMRRMRERKEQLQ